MLLRPKSTLENLFSLAAIRFIEVVTPILSLPYLMMTIGVSEYGRMIYALSLGIFLAAIVQYGFNVTATRDIARNQKNIEQLSKIASRITTASAYLTITAGIILLLLMETFSSIFESKILFWLAYAQLASQSLFPIWFFQGMERITIALYLSALSRISYLVLLFAIVSETSSAELVLFLNFLCALMPIFIAFAVIRLRYGVRFQRPQIGEVVETIKVGRAAFFLQLAPNFYNATSTFILGATAHPQTFGNYAVALRVVDLVTSIGNTVTTALLPKLSKDIRLHSRIIRNIFLLGAIFTLITILSADQIEKILFNSINDEFVNNIILLSFRILPVLGMTALGSNYFLLIETNNKYQIIVVIISLIFGAAATAVVPLNGATGAVIIMIGAPLTITVLSLALYFRVR